MPAVADSSEMSGFCAKAATMVSDVFLLGASDLTFFLFGAFGAAYLDCDFRLSWFLL